MTTYFDERDLKNTKKIRELRDQLPEFSEEFFIGIESQTTPLTRMNYAYDLRVFFNYLLHNVRAFGSYTSVYDFTVDDLNKITLLNLEQYMEYLTCYEFGGRTYTNKDKGKARKLSAVRSFYKYYFTHDRIPSNVTAKLTMPKHRDKDIIRLESNEITKILDITEHGANDMSKHQRKIVARTRKRDLAIITMLLGTGIRVSECVGLNISDIDFENNAFTIIRKGGNQAILYFGDEVKTALQDYISTEREELINSNAKISAEDRDALFLSLQLKRISVRSVEIMVKKFAIEAAPLKKISPHKLRSTFGTNLYQATGDIYMVADVLGHKDVNTTKKHYAAIKQDNRKIAAEIVKLRK